MQLFAVQIFVHLQRGHSCPSGAFLALRIFCVRYLHIVYFILRLTRPMFDDIIDKIVLISRTFAFYSLFLADFSCTAILRLSSTSWSLFFKFLFQGSICLRCILINISFHALVKLFIVLLFKNIIHASATNVFMCGFVLINRSNFQNLLNCFHIIINMFITVSDLAGTVQQVLLSMKA